MDVVRELFDSYGRTARLYPAVIFLLPLLWYLPLLGIDLSASVFEGVVAAVAFSALLYLIATIARHKGKAAEAMLISRWGGWPTTILLRHRDVHIDEMTKARYHGQLNKLTGVALPSAIEEAQQPEKCDAVYRSATKALIEARRDESHALLHKENAAYGFRRNLYGLRSYAIWMVIILAAGTLALWFADSPRPLSASTLWADLKLNKPLLTALFLDVLYFAGFWLVITPTFVLQAGIDYAMALLRTLDKPAS
ncbi:MAG: hypothetical protein H6935_11210 [Thiobacillus sp.]|nr:hypothetical protein [Thiobacillus sp.]